MAITKYWIKIQVLFWCFWAIKIIIVQSCRNVWMIEENKVENYTKARQYQKRHPFVLRVYVWTTNNDSNQGPTKHKNVNSAELPQCLKEKPSKSRLTTHNVDNDKTFNPKPNNIIKRWKPKLYTPWCWLKPKVYTSSPNNREVAHFALAFQNEWKIFNELVVETERKRTK